MWQGVGVTMGREYNQEASLPSFDAFQMVKNHLTHFGTIQIPVKQYTPILNHTDTFILPK